MTLREPVRISLHLQNQISGEAHLLSVALKMLLSQTTSSTLSGCLMTQMINTHNIFGSLIMDYVYTMEGHSPMQPGHSITPGL